MDTATEIESPQCLDESTNSENANVSIGKYVYQANSLFISSVERNVMLNKVTGEIKLNVLSEINECFEEKLNTLKQKVDDATAQTEEVITNMRLDKYEINRLREKNVNTQEILNALCEIYQNLHEKSKTRKQMVAELTGEVRTVQSIIEKEIILREELEKLKKIRQAQQSEEPILEPNYEVIQENLRLKQRITLETEKLNHLRSENENLQAFAAQNHKLKVSLNQLQEQSVSINMQLDEKRKLLDKQNEEMEGSQKALELRLNEVLSQKQMVMENHQRLLTNMGESNATLSKQLEQLGMYEKELESVKNLLEETQKQSFDEERRLKASLEETKEKLLVSENEFEKQTKIKRNLEEEVTSLKDHYLTLLTERQQLQVQNLHVQNLTLRQEKAYVQLKLQNERLTNARDTLLQAKNKNENLDNNLKDKTDFFKKLKSESEEELKKSRAKHDASVTKLKQRMEYLMASRNFIEEKIETITAAVDGYKKKMRDLAEKNDLDKIIYESKKQKLDFLKQKLENDKDILTKLKSGKLLIGSKPPSKVKTPANSPIGILKSPKASQTPKTPRKKVKFEGMLSDSGSEKEHGVFSGSSTSTFQSDKFDEWVKSLSQ